MKLICSRIRANIKFNYLVFHHGDRFCQFDTERDELNWKKWEMNDAREFNFKIWIRQTVIWDKWSRHDFLQTWTFRWVQRYLIWARAQPYVSIQNFFFIHSHGREDVSSRRHRSSPLSRVLINKLSVGPRVHHFRRLSSISFILIFRLPSYGTIRDAYRSLRIGSARETTLSFSY